MRVAIVLTCGAVFVAGCAGMVPSAAPTPTPALLAQDLGLGESLDPALGNPGYDVKHYQLDLDWNPMAPLLTASVTVEAIATTSLTSVNLDFIGFAVQNVQVDGIATNFARTDRDMTVRVPHPVAAGDAFSVRVEYLGNPQPITSMTAVPAQLGWNVAGKVSYVVSEPDGARGWFPCNDHPTDKATYTFNISVPAGLTAAANGVLASHADANGKTTFVWQMTSPMATYTATVVTGDFEIVEDAAASVAAGIPVRNVVPRELETGSIGMDTLARQGEMIAFHGSNFGQYPFAASGVALLVDFTSALENQTMILASPEVLDVALSHELGHQWFGNSASVERWNDIWLSEGFATYAEWLWNDHVGTLAIEAAASAAHSTLTGLAPPGNPPADNLFNPSVYGRGALVLYALRHELGDDGFFATMRAYATEFGGANATSDDFIAVAERVSGEDLTELFDLWLYGAEMPPLPTD